MHHPPTPPIDPQTATLRVDLLRRNFIRRMGWGVGLACFTTAGYYAEALTRTPSQTEGPFYPDKLPLDTDNDLIVVNDSTTPAVGEVAWVTGKVLDARGEPIRGAVVEIWQCDRNGAYLHSGTGNKDKRDTHFQGFGRFVTGSSGEYLFRTIKPVAYTGRTAHIHYAVKTKGHEKFTTQLYIKGNPDNAKDGVWKGIKDERQRNSVTVPFTPLKGSKVGELTARMDLVMGFTPTH